MAARKSTAKLLVARETFTTDVRGETVIVQAGTELPASSPLVKGREGLFEPKARPA
jgi:hypothetical protein